MRRRCGSRLRPVPLASFRPASPSPSLRQLIQQAWPGCRAWRPRPTSCAGSRSAYCFKLFPASIAGGPEALRAFAGPFPGVRFCPTGGIDRASVGRYLELGNVACVGGSWVATEKMIDAGDWEAIRANAEFVTTLRVARTCQ